MLLETNNPWNSLEIMKLLVSGLTPVILAFAGLYLNRRLKKFEHRQWRNQKLIEKRLAIYDEIAPLLNDFLCYYTYVGRWKDFKPEDIINKKRIFDQKFHIAAPLFSSDFSNSVKTFMNLCFKIFNGKGQSAQMLTALDERKNALGNEWNGQWDQLFTNNKNEITSSKKIREQYLQVMKVFADDIGLNENMEIHPIR